MENIIKSVTDGVKGIALWSDEWNTYINCYLVKDNKGFLLIDTGSKDHSDNLIQLLSSENIEKSDIISIIATHGHRDHIGNTNLFENACKFIHSDDINLVHDNERENYKILYGGKGGLYGFEWVLFDGHTPGSIVLYHKNTKTLFAGDFICFFGFPLPLDGLVSEAAETRNLWFEFISSGELSKHLRAQNADPLAIAKYFQKMGAYDADYLCTGHGVVLKNQISSFFNKLSDEIIKYESNK